MTAAVVGLIAHYVAGQAGPAAIVIGNGLALSSTAVVLQVTFLVVFKIPDRDINGKKQKQCTWFSGSTRTG